MLVDQYTFTCAHTKTEVLKTSVNFHLHNNFEIYFLLSDDVNYFVEKSIYSLKRGDLIVLNNHEIHRPSFVRSLLYERIVIHFDPGIVSSFEGYGFDLLDCFVNRASGTNNLISLSNVHFDRIYSMLKEIELHSKNDFEESSILKMTAFINLLVYINKLFKSGIISSPYNNMPKMLIPIFEYIDLNIASDLSYNQLESVFHINGCYLARLFKKHTGSSLHEYIIYKRISLAKKLLSDGSNATQACTLSGFNDYSNFLKMFKKTVGINPGSFNGKS